MNISTTLSALVFLFGASNSVDATTLNSGSNIEQTNVASVDAPPSFIINGKDVCVDDEFTVPITVTDFTMLTSFQFTIGWDVTIMSFDTISYISPSLSNIFLFNDMSTDNGVLTISWYDQSVGGVTVDDLTEIFRIKFLAVGDNQTSTNVTFENQPTMKEVSGFVGNDIMLIEAIYNEGAINVNQQELQSSEVYNDVDDANVGGVDITVNNGTAPYEYVWSNDSEAQNLVNVGVGNYMVTVTDAKGCATTFGEFTVDNTVNVNEISSLKSISLFPNPANELVHLNATFENPEDLEISIFNILGERVLIEQRETANLDLDLNISNLSTGNYFLQLKTSAGTHTEKIEVIR